MEPHRWLAELEMELQRRRLPRRYVTRLVRELSDHVMDAWEISMIKDDQSGIDPESRLGSPREVAESAEQTYCSRTFAAQHPVWMFGVLPPLLFAVVAFTIYFMSAAVFKFLVDSLILNELASSTWLPTLAQGYLVGCLILASVSVAVTFSLVARRYAIRRRWPMVAAVIIAVLCGGFWSQVTPKTPREMGRVTIGFSLAMWPSSITVARAVQFGAPLAVAFWLTRRRPATHLPMAT